MNVLIEKENELGTKNSVDTALKEWSMRIREEDACAQIPHPIIRY